MSKEIKKNVIRCTHCGDVIESKSVHDFRWCRCHTVFVDGGHEYLRRGFMVPEDYEELSEYYEDGEVVKNRYRAVAKVTSYCYLDIDASNLDEAWKIAEETDGGEYIPSEEGDWEIVDVDLYKDNEEV